MKGKAKVVKMSHLSKWSILEYRRKIIRRFWGRGGGGEKEKAEKGDIALSSKMPCPLSPKEDLILKLDQAMPLLTFRNL